MNLVRIGEQPKGGLLMANFLARVELHNATYQDYEALHGAMKRRGYSRTVVSNDRKKYRLPTGTYVTESTNATLEQAYSAAVAAANDTRKSFWAIVVDWSSASFALEELTSVAASV
jgi:hypothetical protein